MKAILKISKNEFDEVNKYLADGNDLKVYDLEKDSTLLSLTATFDNLYKAIVEVFTGEESVMATAYLYNQEGECVEYIESDECLDTQYNFDFDDNKYTLALEIH